MKERRAPIAFGLIAALVLAAVSTGAASGMFTRPAAQAPASSVAQAPPQGELFGEPGLLFQDNDLLAPDAAGPRLVLSYAAKYVCTRAIQPGMQWFFANTPLVHQETDILIHNPNDFTVDLYLKATRPDGSPTPYRLKQLKMDEATTIDCAAIYNLLGLPSVPQPGVDLIGFVVIQIGPQAVGSAALRHAQLDVTAEYVRGSEVLKKDIHYQPWWIWWPWPLPWRLGYPYERLIPVTTITTPEQTNQLEINLDCNQMLANQLVSEVAQSSMDQAAKVATMSALSHGANAYHDPLGRGDLQPGGDPALVALIGGCKKVMMSVNGYDNLYLDVDYVILSNKSPLEYPGPLGSEGGASPDMILPPWNPGFWYDLPVVSPQNQSTDLNLFFRDWHAQRWIEAGLTDLPTVQYNMRYFFPYWCGWGYWAWWWNAGGCTDIGVGEGESLDVEQVTPVRVIMASWPPDITVP